MILEIKNRYSPVAQKHPYFQSVSLFEDEKIVSLFYTSLDFLKEIMKEKIFLSEEDREQEEEVGNRELSFEEEKNYYAMLFALIRLTKFFRHICMTKYLHLVEGKVPAELNIDDAVAVFKKNRILTSEEEENSFYMIEHLSELLSNDFLFKEEDVSDLGFTFLSEDAYMTLELDNEFIFSLVHLTEEIVKRIYNL
jgi:hypothetical protein